MRQLRWLHAWRRATLASQHMACASDIEPMLRSCLHRQDLLNISPIVTDAAAAVVDDSFLRCFQGAGPDPWNWNVYLFPTWCLGCVIRFGLLFPLRYRHRLPFMPCAPLKLRQCSSWRPDSKLACIGIQPRL